MRNFILRLWNKYKYLQWKRKCIKYFGCEPETIYVSVEAYDELMRRLNEPPDPKAVEHFKKIMSKKPPWDEE